MPDWAQLPAQAWRRAHSPMRRVAGIADLRRGADCAEAARRTGADLRRRAESQLGRRGCSRFWRAHEVRATFFLLGSRAEGEPELVRRIAAEGHLVGNHSWRHPNLARSPASRVSEELERTNETLEQIAGTPVKIFPAAVWGAAAGGVSHCARDWG